MRIVDAGLVVAALTNKESVGTWAEDVIASGELAAPHLMPVEVANVLRKSETAGKVSSETVSMAHSELMSLKVKLFPYHPFSSRIWELRANVTAYDAWYVALAEFLDVPLVTVDSRLSRATGPRCAFELPPA